MFHWNMGRTIKELTSNASRHAGNGKPNNGLKGVIRTRHHVEAVAEGNTASARTLGSESTEGQVSVEVGQLGKLFGASIRQEFHEREKEDLPAKALCIPPGTRRCSSPSR